MMEDPELPGQVFIIQLVDVFMHGDHAVIELRFGG